MFFWLGRFFSHRQGGNRKQGSNTHCGRQLPVYGGNLSASSKQSAPSCLPQCVLIPYSIPAYGESFSSYFFFIGRGGTEKQNILTRSCEEQLFALWARRFWIYDSVCTVPICCNHILTAKKLGIFQWFWWFSFKVLTLSCEKCLHCEPGGFDSRILFENCCQRYLCKLNTFSIIKSMISHGFSIGSSPLKCTFFGYMIFQQSQNLFWPFCRVYYSNALTEIYCSIFQLSLG